MANKTSLKDDIKTMWVDGCKELVGWLSSFGKPKTNPALEKEMRMMYTTKKPKRARGKKGRYLADDPTTKGINEAWVGGKAPKKGKKK